MRIARVTNVDPGPSRMRTRRNHLMSCAPISRRVFRAATELFPWARQRASYDR